MKLNRALYPPQRALKLKKIPYNATRDQCFCNLPKRKWLENVEKEFFIKFASFSDETRKYMDLNSKKWIWTLRIAGLDENDFELIVYISVMLLSLYFTGWWTQGKIFECFHVFYVLIITVRQLHTLNWGEDRGGTDPPLETGVWVWSPPWDPQKFGKIMRLMHKNAIKLKN